MVFKIFALWIDKSAIICVVESVISGRKMLKIRDNKLGSRKI
jgi:hypothetical protein